MVSGGFVLHFIYSFFYKTRGLRILTKNLRKQVEINNDKRRESDNFDKRRRVFNLDKFEEIFD